MIHITLTGVKGATADDPLGRTRYGYAPDMAPEEIYRNNHGYYILGARADRERYALFSAPHKPGPNEVVLAVEIDSIDPVPARPGHRQICGKILREGNEVYDAYVGKPTPAPTARNPVTYIDTPFDVRLCACGCGTGVSRGPFISGHDQRALHDRVAKIGSVSDFLRWFDQTYRGGGQEVTTTDPRLRRGQPRAYRSAGWDFDLYEWPDGLGLSICDDGSVKLAKPNTSVSVQDVSNLPAGMSPPRGQVTVLFTPAGESKPS